ncbi:DUF1906 domain-containing protein [Paenibacillus sanguinis]|uniref:DUF1906 domain-containing protein n=1 Tax=Paenibacillus sanguinis TaxID=225906 RepID=UPI000363F634|nr:DUF1906 domain-containing protein [Paenibacillus sanguinis]
MKKGIDCAAPITAANAKKIATAGYTFAARYLVPQRLGWKRLNRAEAEAITAAGMKVISVFETSASRPAGGSAAGQVDGAEAFKEAKLIKQPVGSVIYFAVDYDAQAKDFDKIEAYLKAAASQIPGYKVGVYGSYRVIEEMSKRKAASAFWQTYAWSGGKKSSKANVYQYKNGQSLTGMTVDFNESYGGEGWWDTSEADKPVTPPAIKHKVQPGDAEKIIRFLSAAWFVLQKNMADEFNRLADELRRGTDIQPGDAEKIIRFLSAGWYIVQEYKEARDEFNRLADQVRLASGLKAG